MPDTDRISSRGTRSLRERSSPRRYTGYQQSYVENMTEACDPNIVAANQSAESSRLNTVAKLNRQYPHAPPPRSRSNVSIGYDPYIPSSPPQAGWSAQQRAAVDRQVPQRQPSQSSCQDFEDVVPEDYYRSYQRQRSQGPRHLLPTPVRCPKSFKYEMKPTSKADTRQSQHGSSASLVLDKPQYQPAGPREQKQPSHQYMPGSYRKISAAELGQQYARATAGPTSPPPPSQYQYEDRTACTRPFVYDQHRGFPRASSHPASHDQSAQSGERIDRAPVRYSRLASPQEETSQELYQTNQVKNRD